MKRAQFLELDFLIALLILIAGILVLKGQYIHTYETPQVETAAADVNKLLRTTTLGDLDPSYVASLQQELEGTSVNATNETSIARLAAMLYITGLNDEDTQLQSEARNLLRQLSDQADISTSYNVTIHSNNRRYNLHTSTEPLNKTATTTRSLLSGFQVGQPLVGHTATAYLSKGGTTRHAITRLGGFIGQGNITLQLDIPSHADSIDELHLEGEFHEDFTIEVNDDHCEDINAGSHVSETLGCEDNLRTGSNDITIRFTSGTLADHYASGGLIKATYTSDEHYRTSTTTRKSLPSIEGVTNIYDAIMIPGKPTSITARLRYQTDHSQHDNNVILALGNTTIHEDDTSTAQQDVQLDNDDFESSLDYDDLEDATLPLRFGYENATTTTIVEGASDTILVTDVSDSMDEEICEDAGLTCTYNYDVYPVREGYVTCNLYSWESCQGDVCRYDRPQWWDWDILQTWNHDMVTACSYDYQETAEESSRESCYIGVEEDCQGDACEADGIQDEDTYDHYSYTSDGSCRYDFQYPYTVSRHEDGCVIPQLNHDCRGDPCDNILSYATSSSTSNEQSQEHWATATCSVPAAHECVDDRCGEADGADTRDHTTTTRYAIGSCSLAEEQPCQEGTCEDAPPDASNYRRVDDECRYDYPDGYTCEYNYHAGTRCEYDYTYTYNRDGYGYCPLTYLDEGEKCMQGEGDVCDDAPDNAFNFHDYEERDPYQYCRYWYDAEITSWTGTSCVLAEGETCADDVCGDADGNPTRNYNTQESCGYDYSAVHDTSVRSGTADCPLTPGDDCEENYCNEEVADDELLRTSNHQEVTEQDCTTRLELAKDVQQGFVTDILNSGDNNIGLVTYDGEVQDTYGLSDDESALTNAIEDYDPQMDETCIACGVAEAIRRLESSETSYQSIVLLSDGIPNTCYDDPHDEFPDSLDCPNDFEDWDEQQEAASQQAVAYAEYAVSQGYSIYTIFFRDESDAEFDEGNQTMLDIASADDASHHYVGDSTQGLIDAYDDIQDSILEEGGYEAQVATLDDPGAYLDLLEGSYVEVEYEPWEEPDESGRILIQGEQRPFGNGDHCTATDVDFPQGIQPYDGFVTSYSRDHWTDRLRANGETVYDLSSIGDDYQVMGDPFAVQLPPGTLEQEDNDIEMRVSAGPEQDSQTCSQHNALYYNAFLDSTISLDAVYPRADGCTWTVTMDDDTERHYPIPSNYGGGNTCTYPGTYDDEDAWQALGHELFTMLDLDNDGGVDVDFEAADLELHAEQRSDIPYLWGPAILEVTAWN